MRLLFRFGAAVLPVVLLAVLGAVEPANSGPFCFDGDGNMHPPLRWENRRPVWPSACTGGETTETGDGGDESTNGDGDDDDGDDDGGDDDGGDGQTGNGGGDADDQTGDGGGAGSGGGGANGAPVFSAEATNQTATEDIAFSYTVPAATDPEGGTIAYMAALADGSALPGWLAFDAATRTFFGTPREADAPASLRIRVTAADDGSPALTDTTAFTLTAVEVNEAPAFTAEATNQTATEDTAFGYTVPAASDPEGGTIAYMTTLADGSALPGWLAFDAATRTFFGTPREAAAPASLRIRVTAADDGSPALTATTSFTLTAVEINDAPAFTAEATNQTATEDAAFGYTVPAATDPEGGPIAYMAALADGSALPGWLTFDAATRTFSGTPREADAPASLRIRVTAADDGSPALTATTAFTLTVVEVNQAPAFTAEATNRTATEDTAFSYTVPAATDPEGGSIAYAAALANGSALPDWLFFNSTARTFSGTPREADAPASLRIRVTAADDGSPALTDTTSFTLTTVEVNEAPAFTAEAENRTATEDVAFGYTVPAATDPEGGTIAYAATLADGSALRGWLAFDAATRTFSGTPREADAPASLSIRVTAADSGSPALTATTAFTLTVVEVNEAPAFTAEATNQTATEDTAFGYTVPAASDPEGGPIAYMATLADGSALPGWLAFDAATRTFSGTPREADAPASLSIRVTAADDGNPPLTNSTFFTLTVHDDNAATNGAPAFSAETTNQALAQDTAFSYTVPAASDPEGGTVAYMATLADGSVLPDWLAFDAATRTFSGTPREADAPASLSIRVTASDDGSPALTDTTTFTLTVVEVNEVPVFRAEPPTQWLARFGRTVAGHVLDGMQERLATPQGAGMRATLVGHTLPGDNGMVLAGWLRDDGETRGLHVDGYDPGPAAGFRSRTLTGREIVTGTAFAVTGGKDDGGRTGFWGRGAIAGFDGRGGGLVLDGEVTTGLLGADYASGGWLGGLIVAHSGGEGSYRGTSAGTVSSTLTGLYPWARYAISERLSVWSMAGYGAGALTLTPAGPSGEEMTAMKADTSLAMAAAGVRSELVAPEEAGGPALALESDAMFVRTASDATAELASSEADVSRLRLALDGSWRFLLENGGALTPSLGIGGRHDGGDAETGFGVELGGGIAWVDPGSGLAFALNGRVLAAHEAKGFRERGLSAALAWDPDPSSERGPSLSLTQTLGTAGAQGGTDGLFGSETPVGLWANDDTVPSGRLEAEFDYGLGAFGGRFTGTPYAGFGHSEAERIWRLGWRLARPGDPGSLRFSLEASRRESTGGTAEHGIGIRAAARW